MKKCGCQSDNFCLLCKNGPAVLRVEEAVNKPVTRQFVYCALCERKAFRADLDHQSHSDERLVELEDYVAIDGLMVCDEVIDLKLENQLISRMDQDEWMASQTGRRKQDFGPKVNFKKRRWKLGDFKGLPALPMQVLEQLIEEHPAIGAKLKDFRVIEVCNLEYAPERGSYITAHYDDFYFWGRRVVTLNLLSATKLTLTRERPNKSSQTNGQTNMQTNMQTNDLNQNKLQTPRREPAMEIIVNLARRSLLVLSGEARYEWKHELRPEHIEKRRLAVTYRESGEGLMASGSEQLLELATHRV